MKATEIVRMATRADLDALLAAGDPRMAHHDERLAAQEKGWVTYLLARRGTTVVGHVVVRRHSKYQPVVDLLGEFREINALAAYQTGTGVGGLLLDAAEAEVRRQGERRVGLAVETTNPARRLYERRGYTDWGNGHVVDIWDEVANDGTIVATHHETCDYLVKAL